MCGPADFGALHTCIVRLAELSAVGLAGYSVYQTGVICRELCRRRAKRDQSVLRDLPARLNDRAQSCDTSWFEAPRGLKPAARQRCGIAHDHLAAEGSSEPQNA